MTTNTRERLLESPPPLLPETLQRLDRLIADQGLDRSEILSPERLAAQTALPVATVRTLLDGGTVAEGDVADRVCSRVQTLADAYMARANMKKPDLLREMVSQLGISPYWARLICEGKKTPNVEVLHGLVKFFEIGPSGEAFFTDAAPDALNRVLLPVVQRYENPQQDPLEALLEKYNVKAADFRHYGTVTPEQLEALFAGVLKSVMPEGDPNR